MLRINNGRSSCHGKKSLSPSKEERWIWNKNDRLVFPKIVLHSPCTYGNYILIHLTVCCFHFILQKGADQEFHNYLYYSNKLVNVAAISSITVLAQGKGSINNVGALRTKLWQNGGTSMNQQVLLQTRMILLVL